MKIRARKWKRECSEPKISFSSQKFDIKPILSVNAGSVDCLKAAVDGGADVVYLSKWKKHLGMSGLKRKQTADSESRLGRAQTRPTVHTWIPAPEG